MKSKFSKLFLAVLISTCFAMTSNVADAYWYYGHWYHHHHGGVYCRWVGGYWANGYWHEPHRVCWRR